MIFRLLLVSLLVWGLLGHGVVAVFAAEDAASLPELAPVVVKDDARERAKKKNPSSAVEVAQPKKERAAESVRRLLDSLPGIEVRSIGDEAHLFTISIRGSASDSIAVFVDGIPINDPFTGAADLSIIPVEFVKRIEVHYTHPPLLLYEESVGGTVNIITGTDRGASASLKLGSFGYVKAAAYLKQSGLTLAFSHFSSVGNFSFLNRNGTYSNPSDDFEDIRQNNDASRTGAMLQYKKVLHLERLRALVFGSVSFIEKHAGSPGISHMQAEHSSFDGRYVLAFVGLDLSNRNRSIGGKLRLSFDHSSEDFHDPYAEASMFAGKSTTGISYGSARMLTFLRPFDWMYQEFLLAFGIANAGSREDTYVERISDISFKRHSLLLGEETRIKVWLFELLASVRGSMVWNGARELIENSLPLWSLNEKSFYGSVGGRLGAVLSLLDERVRLRVQASRRQRMPTLVELFGKRGAIVGNPALLPESSITSEWGMDLSFSYGSFTAYATVNGFVTWSKDLIVFIQNSQRTVMPQNVSSARISGDELVLRLSWKTYVTLSGSYSHTIAIDGGEISYLRNKFLPGIPQHTVIASIDIRPLEPIEFYALARYSSTTFADRANKRSIDSHTFITLGATLRFDKWLAMNVEVENVSDVRTYTAIGYPLPGRRFFVGLTVFAK